MERCEGKIYLNWNYNSNTTKNRGITFRDEIILHWVRGKEPTVLNSINFYVVYCKEFLHLEPR